MRILIQDIKVGMQVLEDVSHPRGGVLIKKGQKLTVEMVGILKRLGIREIQVNAVPNGQEFNSQERNAIPPTYPEIKVQIQTNLLSASLSIEPKGSNCSEITEDDLTKALQAQGIIYGINRNEIRETVIKWKQKKQLYKINEVAKGLAPEAGHESSVEMKVKHLSKSVYFEKVKKSRYFWEVEKLIPEIQRIKPGDIIAELNEKVPPVSGINIKGETVETTEMIKTDFHLSEGVHFAEGQRYIVADKQGIAYYCDGKIGILFINFNGSVDLIINNDKSAAKIIVHKASDGGTMPSEKEIRLLLEKHGVIFGIDETEMQNLITNFSKQIYPTEPLLIARALPARDGDDGRYEILFDTETSLKPQLNPDGSVDYKSVKIVHTVEKNQKLAHLLPPTKGRPGKNIAGQEISCVDGKATSLPAGTNTEIDSNDPSYLIATTNGIVKFNNSTIEVTEGLVIPGNVNFSTGNINYEKTVVVNGDVKSGFDITCGGDCQIGGAVEDCHIKVGGNFLCRFGFIGQGRGVIDVHGDANLSFTKNQLIKSKQSVNIAKEAINCTIYAKKTITIHGKPLSVAGGNLTAAEGIILFSVGNQSGIKTVLEVGVDFTLVEELAVAESQFLELSENYSKLIESKKKYEKNFQNRKQLTIKEHFMLTKINDSIAKYNKQLGIVEAHKAEISTKMYNLNDAFIKIDHSAMPGTLFKFGERHFLVKEEIIGPKTVRLIDHEIKVI